MRIVIDGLPIRGQSLAIVVEHLLEGWQQLDTNDELHIVTGPDAEVRFPEKVTVHRVEFGKRHFLSRLRAQAMTVPRLCRELRADAMLGVLPTTVVTPLPCPRALIAYDLRHEQRPEQFSRAARLLRKVSYGVGFRQADAIACISDRTRQDLMHSRPWLRRRTVRVALLGGDHVDAWPPRVDGPEYALAFGQYGNKNVRLVVDAWAELKQRGPVMPIVIVGLGAAARADLQQHIDRLGVGDVVTALPWLSDEQFRERFASASLIVFPSDFEGFGMPAVEAMRLGVPLVITPERALLEVCGGHATVMDGWGPQHLADAVVRAVATSKDDLAAAREHALAFTWARTAEQVRQMLQECVTGRPVRMTTAQG